MAREPFVKILNKTRLANNYGGWMYCEQCEKSIGYLCYVTYERFEFHYTCNCGNKGDMLIEFCENLKMKPVGLSLKTIKNRLCCPNDDSPLFTVLSQNLTNYHFEVLCNKCNQTFKGSKKEE